MPSGIAMGRMYLIDAHSLIFQVFHAIGEMSSPSGLPVNAVYGFTRDLLFLRERQPDYLLCAFDRSEPTFRTELYIDYKAHRAPMPDDLSAQMPLIHQLVEAMGIPVLSMPGYEADDILATVSVAAAERGLDVLLCTSDKDCRQLLSDRIRLYNLRKRQEFGKDELLKEWGVKPEQVVDLQALVGDPVDNVPGAPGIGIKTAAKLLQEFGTLDQILANIDRITGAKRQENLRAWAPQAELSRRLVRLDSHVPLTMDWESWKLQPWDSARLLSLFRGWGFRTFAEQIRHETTSQSGWTQQDLFPFGANANREEENSTANTAPDEAGWRATYHLVDTQAKFQDFLRQLRAQTRVAIDLETTSLDARKADIVGYALAWRPEEAWYLPVRGPTGDAVLDADETLRQLRPFLENPHVAKVNQNIKYDLLVLRRHGVMPAGVTGDPMVADYLLHAGRRSHNLEFLAQEYLHHQVIPITDLIGKKTKNQPQRCMDAVPTTAVAEYSGEDADVAWRLCELLETELHGQQLKNLYDDVEVPLIEVLAEMEHNGIRLDVPFLQRLSAAMADELATIEREIHRLAGHEFNIASPKQMRQVLFDELRLPTQRKTGITGEASTNQESLERLAILGHELPRKILEHRHLAKLKGTYVDALPELVDSVTLRIHASFNQTVAATGRLSSSDPNLQNIPVRSEQGRQIRQAFLPAEGWLLLTVDYSQIELRLLAHFCDDAELRRAFIEDRDVHAAVAAQIFHVAEQDVTAGMRRLAKTVNFGVIYGMSAHGLGQRLGMPREEAARFITAYFARYPQVLEYQTRLLEKCRQQGYVSSILGRRRAFESQNIRPESTYQQRNQTEREAINMEIQGSAADLIKLAMLNIYRRLRREGHRTKLLLQIHDELVFETPPDELDTVAALIREEMTTPLQEKLHLEVPLMVDLAAGSNWLEVVEFPWASTDFRLEIQRISQSN